METRRPSAPSGGGGPLGNAPQHRHRAGSLRGPSWAERRGRCGSCKQAGASGAVVPAYAPRAALGGGGSFLPRGQPRTRLEGGHASSSLGSTAFLRSGPSRSSRASLAWPSPRGASGPRGAGGRGRSGDALPAAPPPAGTAARHAGSRSPGPGSSPPGGGFARGAPQGCGAGAA